MSDVPPPLNVVSSDALIRNLEARLSGLDPADVLLVFDGDGTLWSGDVGNEVFDLAVRSERFHESLRARLRTEAQRHALHLDLAAPVSALAAAFVGACQSGEYPESDLCALQAWCYAGFTETELHALVREALGTGFEARYQKEVRRVIRWARSESLRSVVVSASPRVLVEQASAALGFRRDDIVAVEVLTGADGVFQDDIVGQVPYGDRKVTLARKRYGTAHWLAAFGDNGFDAPMLAAAQLGVAVRPKPALLRRLPELSNAVHLLPDD
jgi:phosphatidylglycerophosphatase C